MQAPALLPPAALLLLAASAAPAIAAGPDWPSVADEGTVEVVTTNEDGSARETTIWLVVVDGAGYIRTGNTRWGSNVVRDPRVVLRIGESEHPLRAELVSDEELRERVMAAFRDKYGFSDRLASLFRIGRARIMHLVERTGETPAGGGATL